MPRTKKATSRVSRNTTTEEEIIKHPKHYNNHPSGVECIVIAQEFNFNIGNAIKYLWRAGLKSSVRENLLKAKEYIDFELRRRGGF